MNENETKVAAFKITLLTIAGAVAEVTLERWLTIAILVYTLAERFKQTQAVGRLKAEHDLPPSDPDREARQMARLDQLAQEADLDPDLAKKFLTFIISEVIRHHEKLQK